MLENIDFKYAKYHPPSVAGSWTVCRVYGAFIPLTPFLCTQKPCGIFKEEMIPVAIGSLDSAHEARGQHIPSSPCGARLDPVAYHGLGLVVSFKPFQE